MANTHREGDLPWYTMLGALESAVQKKPNPQIFQKIMFATSRHPKFVPEIPCILAVPNDMLKRFSLPLTNGADCIKGKTLRT